MNTLQDLIKKYASQYKEQVVEWRRHIHSHPELSGEEKNTSLFIQKVLTELGIPFVMIFLIMRLSVQDRRSSYRSRYCIACRYRCITPFMRRPVYHLLPKMKVLCMLVDTIAIQRFCFGAAAILQSIKDQLHGTVKLVFQPSEEEALFPGAQGIVDSGILDDVDEIYGLHVWPQLPVGTVGLKKR